MICFSLLIDNGLFLSHVHHLFSDCKTIYHLIKLQGVYTFDLAKRAIQVNTFCVHGSPDGYITGIRGNVQCLSDEDLEKKETDLEKQEMIKEKCFLRFPSLPFIPKLPYDVIATDYDNYALVSGAKDTGFIQVLTRKLPF